RAAVGTRGPTIGSPPAVAPPASKEEGAMQPLMVSAAAVFVALCALFPVEPAVAQTVRYVDNIRSCGDLSPCYSTITAAVDAAAAGDTIEVFPGLYEENVTVEGPSKGALVLRAHDPALKPVIAALSGNAVTIVSAPVQLLNFVIEAPNGAGVTIVGGFSGGFAIQGNRIKSRLPVSIIATLGGSVTGNAFLGGGLSGDLAGARIEANTFVDAGISLFEINQRPSVNLIQ